MSQDDGDDDWFERGLAADDAEESEDSSWDDSDEPDEDGDASWDEGEGGEQVGASETAFDPGESDAEEFGRTDTSGAETPFGDEGGDDPFGDAADSPFSEEAEDAFGGSGGFGAEEFGGGEDMFDDEGFGGFGGDDSEFDDEEFESDIGRLDLGIEGLDNMILGGIPSRHLIVTIGSAGTGKTTFGLQFLYHGLQQGENAVFITLEQSHDSIIATANEWGWDFAKFEEEGSLAIVDLDPVEMANSLNNIQDELPQLVRDFGADRLVLDSVSLLEMMYDDQAKRRTEVFDFTRSLKDADVTTFLTSEASETNPYASRHGIIEYLTDAVFVLQYVRGETQETRLALEILKIRNANHSREKKPYELTDEGLSVYQNANIF